MHIDIFIDTLRNTLPPTFSRAVAAEHLKGILSKQTLANIDSRGEGAPSVFVGRTVCYERESFLAWLNQRIQPRKSGKIGG